MLYKQAGKNAMRISNLVQLKVTVTYISRGKRKQTKKYCLVITLVTS